MAFDVPKDVDNFFTLLFMIAVLLSIGYNVYTGGNATLVFLENEYSVVPNDDPIIDSWIQEYANNTIDKHKRVYWLSFFLYYLGVPLICFYYGYFKFRPEMWGTDAVGGKKLIFDFFRKSRESLDEPKNI